MGRQQELGPIARIVVNNVRRLRERRGWSAADLTARMIDMPHPVSRAQLANLENDRRASLSLDETIALAKVLSVVPWWTLATDNPLCGYCRSKPPPGFVCTVCQLAGPAPVLVVDDPAPSDGADGLFGPEGWRAFQDALAHRPVDFTTPGLSRQDYREQMRGAGDWSAAADPGGAEHEAAADGG